MATDHSSLKVSWTRLMGALIALAAISALFALICRPFFLGITDQGGDFFFTYAVSDLDLDGDPDVLVHSMRMPAEFEAYSGGELCIHQAGLQGAQPGEFACRQEDRAGGRDASIADFDSDGDPDLLMYDGYKLTFGINQGGKQAGQVGVFWESLSIKPPGPEFELYRSVTQLGAIAVGDVDGDGRSDAIVLGCCGRAFTSGSSGASLPNVSWIWFNRLDEDGRFVDQAESLDALEGLPAAQGELADLDGDRDLDLFVVILRSKTRSDVDPGALVLLNDGAGHFARSSLLASGRDSSSFALGDLDSDGDLDALVGAGSGAQVWTNQGGAQPGPAGAFVFHRALRASRVRQVRLADLDGDGDLDALVAGKRRLDIHWNDGQGAFTQADGSLPFTPEQGLTVADFNADGSEDIFITAYARGSTLWLNDGKGAFAR